MEKYEKIISLALMAREKSYSPYSGYRVGACLVTSEGKAYLGCNIENASYGETVCAERVAFYKAISEGEKSFSAIAIVGGKDDILSFAYPCGSCRQVMWELANEDLTIVLYDGENVEETTLEKLLPNGFSKKNIN